MEAGALQILAELGNAVDPTHQVAGGSARVAVGEVEERKILFAVASYFHNAGCLIVVVTLRDSRHNAGSYIFSMALTMSNAEGFYYHV